MDFDDEQIVLMNFGATQSNATFDENKSHDLCPKCTEDINRLIKLSKKEVKLKNGDKEKENIRNYN